MGKKRPGRASGNASPASGVLLGIMLLPVIAVAGAAPAGGSSAANALRSPPAQTVVATDSASRSQRSRRLGNIADEDEYPSPAAMDAVSQYLDHRASREAADPSLAESWNQFHAWADARIRRFASGFRSASVDVDDCAQETWADLITKLKTFNVDDSRGKFSSWLYTLVRNKAADLSRAASRQRAGSLDAPSTEASPQSTHPSPLDELAKKLDREKILGAVEKLRNRISAESSEIVKMRWIDQKPIEEVKTKLGMTANQLWVREHRLREKLRTALGKSFEELQSN